MMQRRVYRGNHRGSIWTKANGRRFRPSSEALEPRQLLAADLIINEFLASNESGLVDGFGERSDWIEILNDGNESAQLGGMHLSDDASELDHWTFPSGTELAPGQYLVVFASGRDMEDPSGYLHTNFRLSAAGEQVILSDSGLNVISSYGTADEEYPDQLADISFGRDIASMDTPLVTPTSDATFRVPTDGSQDASWYTSEFTPDGSWLPSKAAIGYDRFAQQGVPVTGGTAVLQVDFGDDDAGETGVDDTEDGWSTMTLSDGIVDFNGISVEIIPIGGIPLDDRDRTTPTDNPPSLTVDQLYDDFIYARSQTDDTGLEIHITGLVPGQSYEMTLWSFDSGSSLGRVSTWTEVASDEVVEIESTYVFDGNFLPTSDLDDTMSAQLIASETGELRLQGTRNGGTSYGVFINAIQLVVPSLTTLIETDVTTQMADQNSTAQLRIPFDVPPDLTTDRLSLEMEYDSGFVAYLNGMEVARRGAPGAPEQPLAYDSAATDERTVTEVLATETFNISSFADLLVPGGSNVLAIHGLNSAASDNDFVVRPSLFATSIGGERDRYFATPTPGAPNDSDTFEGMVGDTQFSIDRGFYDEAQQLVISVATPGASIIYTLDGSVPSVDNGVRVDAATPATPPSAMLDITTTTYLRAVGVKDGYLPSNVDTQTYIFLDDVVQQSIDPNAPDSIYPSYWQSRNYPADYDMDPEVVAQWDDNNPNNEDIGIREALRSIPTMSIVMEHEDLWNLSSGIYPRAQSQGTLWRRAGSVEYFDPNNGDMFQVNAGIQMHGGASRDNERTKKHSFRLLFKEEYDGPSELNFKLFNDSDLDEINTVVLKSFFTDGFPTRTNTGRYSPLDSQYLRDTWMRDVQNAMGNLDAHSEYVHLYINGLYWGLYSPTERPDDAFIAAYLGGERDDIDIVKDFNELFRGNRNAWNEMFTIANGGLTSAEAYQRIQGNNPDGTDNPDLPNLLDVDNLIDYMISHLYGGAEDWPHHNWYAARDRVGETQGFQFFTWDQEIVLDGRYRDRTNVSDDFTPARLYARLRQNEDFRVRFGDRVYQHLFNDGPLTNENAQALWMRRADQIEAAIIAESARWGDAREGERHRIDAGGPTVTIPVMTVDLWRAERDNVRDNYFPRSHELAVQRFQADNLFPTTMAPVYSQRGGLISSQTLLELEGQGTLYYTLDGSDPRQLGGSVSPTALVYGGPFSLPQDAVVTVRALNNGEWSPIDRAAFEVNRVAADATNFRLSEIHYHPAADEDAEFLEWVNTGDQTISLTNVRVTEGVQFDFNTASIKSIAPGERLLLVRDLAAFSQAAPGATDRVAGQYAANLSNGGETITVLGPNDVLIQTVTYSDDSQLGWPAAADGQGPSLQAINVTLDCPDAVNCNWRLSAVSGGTPGQAPFPAGDSNLDRQFNSSDLVLVFQAGKYESPDPFDASWAEGDWNGDGDFSTSDLVFAFQQGTYSAAARALAQQSASLFQSRNHPRISPATEMDAALAGWDLDDFKRSTAFLA